MMVFPIEVKGDPEATDDLIKKIEKGIGRQLNIFKRVDECFAVSSIITVPLLDLIAIGKYSKKAFATISREDHEYPLHSSLVVEEVRFECEFNIGSEDLT